MLLRKALSGQQEGIARRSVDSCSVYRGFQTVVGDSRPSRGFIEVEICSETGRIRFRRVRFQTPNSVSFSGLTEFQGANSVSSFRPIIFVGKSGLTEFFPELTEFAAELSEAQ